jgi:hypothetical protein
MSEEEYCERIIENQRWLNELSAKEQRKEEQERLEAEEEERAYQLWRNSMGTPAYDPTSPAYLPTSPASAHAAQEAKKREQAWQQEHHRMLHDEKEIEKRKENLAFVQNLVRLMDSDAANREHERQAAIAAVRVSFETGLASIGYGPFKEDIIIAHAECNLMFLPHTKEWNLKFDKYDAVKDWRAWCWSKMHGSISKGW